MHISYQPKGVCAAGLEFDIYGRLRREPQRACRACRRHAAGGSRETPEGHYLRQKKHKLSRPACCRAGAVPCRAVNGFGVRFFEIFVDRRKDLCYPFMRRRRSFFYAE